MKEFRSALLTWFRQFRRDLPWRGTRDPYRIWVSEIMLQQTRVAAVIPFYEKFLERFPSVPVLAAAPEEEVLRMWSGLGYYRRARNLQLAAKQIVAKHGGEFPRSQVQALELPGIGEYTAPAILSMAFGKKLAVLDGNVARVTARLDALRGDLRESDCWRGLRKRAGELLAPDAAGDWNQAMMELGATVCTPRSPQCSLCPVRKFCRASALGIADTIPGKRRKRAEVVVRLAAAVFLDQTGRSILLPPPAEPEGKTAYDHVPSLVAKLWHFPTVLAVGHPETALKQFPAQEFGLKLPAQWAPSALKQVRHTVTYQKIELTPFLVRVEALPPISGARVMKLDAILAEPISNLTRKVARAALEEFIQKRS